ncbi:hypothetical protein BDV96DRAFT_577408 [Lophiotrema nucula]|uniref:Uncharacterized protein n=1 Tax=Lophiotrema nucula TaxID=690887 RepID=A0A6A5Z557_9PLEO|nr:hypothetical protein BDV96DRAFT_577408 [Lophiotrema nucula]
MGRVRGIAMAKVQASGPLRDDELLLRRAKGPNPRVNVGLSQEWTNASCPQQPVDPSLLPQRRRVAAATPSEPCQRKQCLFSLHTGALLDVGEAF